MMRNACWWAALAALALGAGCDDSRSRTEAGLDDRLDRGQLDRGVDDRGPGEPLDDGIPDVTPADAASPDDGAPDLGVDDFAIPDGELPDTDLPDAEAPDAALPDGELPDAGPTGRFVVGEAWAADRRSVVTVRAGEVEAVADADGRFRLGPLEGDAVVIEFSAPDHHAEAVSLDLPPEDGETALPEPMLLYRGVRIGPAATGRLVFRFDEGWFLWEVDDQLLATPTDAIDLRVLAPEAHEVFLGFAADGEAVYTRRRVQPGVAGDIDRRPLDGSPAIPLFVEAQPWVREVGDRLLAMVETREALSRLESTAPGEMPQTLDEGVPWLLVTTLADDQVAWAAGDPAGFAVFVGPAAGGERRQVSAPEGPTTDDFLLTTPDRRGLVWLSPAGDLWRWPGEGAAELLADDVDANPRPRLLRDGRVLFSRTAGGGTAFWLWTPDGNRLVVDGARPNPALLVGETLYVDRPGLGLWAGELNGPDGDEVLPAPIDAVTSSGGGVIALIDGVAWRYRPDTGAERLGGEGLGLMSFAPLGATAWQADAGALWFLPGPGVEGAAARLTVGAPRAGRLNAPGGAALYVLGPDGWFRAALPPGDEADVAFDRPFDDLYPLGPDGLLGRDPDGALWAIDPRTGLTTGWAANVEEVERGPRNGVVAYVCDRGTFLVPVPAE